MLIKSLKTVLKNPRHMVSALVQLIGPIIGLAATIECALNLSWLFWILVPVVAYGAVMPLIGMAIVINGMSKEDEG